MNFSINASVIESAVEGDMAARNQILAACRPLLKLAAFQHCRGAGGQKRFDESDVVQMTCMEAHRALTEFKGRTSAELFSWLNTILQRTVWRLNDRHTTARRDVRREYQPPGNESLSIVWKSLQDPGRGPESRVIAGESAFQVANAIEHLPNHYQSVIRARFIEGLKLREIAVRENLTVGAVAGLLRGALQMLQESLPPELAREMGP